MSYYKNNKYMSGNKKGKSKYSKSEQIAFTLGQQARIKASIRNNPNSRVSEAYKAGFEGFAPRISKPLF